MNVFSMMKVVPSSGKSVDSNNSNEHQVSQNKAKIMARSTIVVGVEGVQKHILATTNSFKRDKTTNDEEIVGSSGMFHEAAEHGSYDLVVNYMKGKRKNSKHIMLSRDSEDLRNALHKAALNGHYKIVKELLKNKIIRDSIDLPDRYGCTALYLACVQARYISPAGGDKASHERTQFIKCQIVRDLLINKASLEKSVPHKSSSLGSCFHWCAAHGFPKLVAILTHSDPDKKYEVDPNSILSLMVQKDSRSRLPIDVAGSIYMKSRYNYEENLPKVNKMLERIGVQIQAPDGLLKESEKKNEELEEKDKTEKKIESLNPVEQQLMYRLRTLAMIANAIDNNCTQEFQKNHAKAYSRLLQSMLSWCSYLGIKSKVIDIMNIALNPKLKITLSWAKLPGENGRTALHYAAMMGRDEIVEELLRFNGNKAINQPDYSGNTPLHLCAMQTNYPVYFGATGATARILLKHGADARILNSLGRSPASYARGNCFDDFLISTSNQKYYTGSCFDDNAIRDPTELSFDWVIRFKSKTDPRCGSWCRTLCGDNCCLKPSEKGLTIIKQAETDRADLAKYLNSKEVKMTALPYDSEDHALLLITALESVLLHHAEALHIELPVLHNRLQEKYQPSRSFVFEPLRSRERVRIIKAVVDKKMDLNIYQKSGVVCDFFPMHETTELEVVKRRWVRGCCPEPFGSPWDLLDENRSSLMTGLTTLGGYFGEEVAMYFSFISFYTLYLGFFLVLPGGLVAIYQIYSIASDGLKRDTLTSPYVPMFAIYLAIWCTILVERWKRKQAELAYRWDTADFVQEETTLNTYWGPERFNSIKGEVEKHFSQPRRRMRQCVGMLPMIVMIGLVISMFQATLAFRRTYAEVQVYPMDMVLGGVAGIIQGATIAVLNYVYKWVAVKVTHYENYKTQTAFDNALIIKIFAFQIVNGNLALFQAAFVDRDPIRLWTLLIFLMSGQQLLDTFKRNVIPRLMFFLRWKAGEEAFLNIMNKIKSKSSTRITPLSGHIHSVSQSFARLLFAEREREKKLKEEQEIDAGIKSSDKNSKENMADQAVKNISLKKIENSADEAIKDALRNCAMEDQDQMMIDNYAVVVSQYTYIVLWSVAFPLAPLFAFLVNFMQIRGEVALYCMHTKRAMPMKEFGIGSWLPIIEIISLLGVVSNTVMIVSTFASREIFLQYVSDSQTSVFQNEYVFMSFVIIIEHVIIGMKLALASLIQDKPAWVLEEELFEREEEMREDERERDLQLQARAVTIKSEEKLPFWFKAITKEVLSKQLNREATAIEMRSETFRQRAMIAQRTRHSEAKERTKKRLAARKAAKSKGSLRRSPVFQKLSEESMTILIDMMDYEKLEGGRLVCQEGSPATKLYLIVAGECEVLDGGSTPDDPSDDVVFTVLKSNDIFGESALLPSESIPIRSKTVRVKAGSTLEALTLDAYNFFKVLKEGILEKDVFDILMEIANERQNANNMRESKVVTSNQ